MIILTLFTLFIFVMFITVGLSFLIKRKWLRCCIIMLSPLIAYFVVFFEDFLQIFVQPIYCHIHQKEAGIVIHTTSEQWQAVKGKGIVIQPLDKSKQYDSSLFVNASDFDFNYDTEKQFGRDKYELSSVNKKNPSIALYINYGFGTLSKKQYLYYDVDKNVILATLSMYRIVYAPWFLNKISYECQSRDLAYELKEYIDKNYIENNAFQ